MTLGKPSEPLLLSSEPAHAPAVPSPALSWFCAVILVQADHTGVLHSPSSAIIPAITQVRRYRIATAGDETSQDSNGAFCLNIISLASLTVATAG
ncbi:Uncharacterised protein [Yersinia enterocolitica]|nr:Uncharacterised protein [Yersinia enterocolitica]